MLVWLIARAFASIGAAWEIVIVDDASPDGTQDVAKQLMSVYGEDRIVRTLSRRLSSCCDDVRRTVAATKSRQAGSGVQGSAL